jgi:hypothetical protein
VNGRTLIALGAAAALMLPASALAATTAERTGSFSARGTGTLVASGRLEAFGRLDGASLRVSTSIPGVVVKRGKVTLRPRIIRTGGKVVRVFTVPRLRGAFYVRGRGLRVELRSPVTPLSVQILGRGAVTRLQGQGTFTLNTDPPQDWSAATPPLQIKPPPPATLRPRALAAPPA